MSTKFPKDFFWGAATSAHQIEGGLLNDWSVWEKDHAKTESEFYKAGKKGFFNHPIGEENLKDACEYDNYISGKAADSFNRYKEDIKLLKELGLNSYRFSIDWSRIEPNKGDFSKDGLDYYRRLIKELRDNNIEPFLTCWHWPIPLWLVEEGGLEAKNVVKYFERYVKVLGENFGQDVKYWMTINEPTVISSCGYLIGKWPPGKKNIVKFLKVCFITFVNMHKAGYKVLKEINADLKVGIVKNNQYVKGYKDRLINKLIASVFRYFSNNLFLNRIKGYMDFIGLNFYQHAEIGILGQKDVLKKKNDMSWGMEPYSIFYVMKDLKEKYDLPVIITENGLADREDKYRKWWLDETYRAMEDALDSGVDLFGYLHWSLLDNFEWAEGFWPRFGLVEVDRKTFDRKIKKSGYYYKQLVERANGKG